MQEGQLRVQLDGEIAVGRGEIDPTADAQQLADEKYLPVAVAHMLDHRVAPTNVELAVGEGELAPVVEHRPHLRVTPLELILPTHAERRDPLRVGIMLLQIINHRVALTLMVGETHVEQRRLGRGVQPLHEISVLARPVVMAHPGRDRFDPISQHLSTPLSLHYISGLYP